MVDETLTSTNRNAEAAAVACPQKISWGSIFAGVTIALVLQITLSLFGLGIGIGTIDPATESNPFGGVATGVGIWTVLSSIAALFIGGFVAAQLSGMRTTGEGLLHGITAWSVATLVGFYLAGSALGAAVSGGTALLGQTMDTLAAGGSYGSAQLYRAVRDEIEASGMSLEEIRKEGRQLLRQTDKRRLQPDNLERRAENSAELVTQNSRSAAKNPQAAEREFDKALDRLAHKAYGVIEAADQQAVVNVLTARTDMSEREARETAESWANQLQIAQKKLSQFGETVAAQAAEASEAALDTLSSASLWTFFALVLGAMASAFGGALGATEEFMVAEVHHTERETV